MIFSRAAQILFCFMSHLLIPQWLSASEEWTLKKQDEQENIQVYYRTLDSGNVEFRGELELTTSLHSCVALLRDVDDMPEWVYNVEQAKVLNIISEWEAYTYVVNSVPFPLDQRDSIVHTLIEQDPATLAITINGRGVPNYIKEKEGFVRIEAVQSFWQFVPVTKDRTKVIFQGFGEPGGNIPANIARTSIFAWLTKTELWKLPFFTLKNLKQHIQKEKYQNAHFSFLKEF